ncbi:RNase H domain-containing protein [Trichonephila clavipes]|nr:RNase H domain-containing protein [Trichonephila clavipes]
MLGFSRTIKPRVLDYELLVVFVMPWVRVQMPLKIDRFEGLMQVVSVVDRSPMLAWCGCLEDSLRQGRTHNFLICTDSLSSLYSLSNVASIEKLVVKVQSILYYLEDCDIHFSYVRGHSENLGDDTVDQLIKEATCQDMDLSMSVLLSHWKHLAWKITVLSSNTKFLAPRKALWTKRFFRSFING